MLDEEVAYLHPERQKSLVKMGCWFAGLFILLTVVLLLGFVGYQYFSFQNAKVDAHAKSAVTLKVMLPALAALKIEHADKVGEVHLFLDRDNGMGLYDVMGRAHWSDGSLRAEWQKSWEVWAEGKQDSGMDHFGIPEWRKIKWWQLGKVEAKDLVVRKHLSDMDVDIVGVIREAADGSGGWDFYFKVERDQKHFPPVVEDLMKKVPEIPDWFPSQVEAYEVNYP